MIGAMECLFVVLLISSTVVSVRGQVVSCRASSTCAGGPGDDLGVAANGEGCCLGNPAALAYTAQGSHDCVACVVVGFIDASFSGVEQEPGHSVPVGYKKGATVAGQNLIFDVRSTPGTAREGTQFDYTVNTVTVRALTNGATSNVELTFRVDSIAQEPNETFTLTLDPHVPPNPRTGLFFQNTIQVAIVDSDNVQFSFTEDSYPANEPSPASPSTFLPVLVTKSARIASRVELVVVPLTVQEARASSLPLPPNIPRDDIRSPPFAIMADFNNTNITLVFEPDEEVKVLEQSTPIFVTNDSINEAREQVFVAELILVSSLDPNTVDLSVRPSTLCRIIDNDPIRIGFELPGYTYEEPQFEEFIDEFFPIPPGRPESGPIFLVKEGGVTSEQTFIFSIQVTDSAPSGTNIQTATFREDYRFADGIRTSLTEFFFPFQQRIPFRFTLFPDDLPEGTEAFHLSASPEGSRPTQPGQPDERFPTSLTPLVLASEVFVTIFDNDPIIIGYCTFFKVIIIGFTNTSYTVSESDGVANIQIRVIQGLLGRRQVTVEFSTGAVSAANGSDYSGLIRQLTFDSSTTEITIPVHINDDNIFEPTEQFIASLAFTGAPPSGVTIFLAPDSTQITILDDDQFVTIGFQSEQYTTSEDSNVATILMVEVSGGLLTREIIVSFSTSDSTATAGEDYVGLSYDLTFDSANTINVVPLTILDDEADENTEIMLASLSFPASQTERVLLKPNTTVIQIYDDDGVTTEPAENNGTITVLVVALVSTLAFLIVAAALTVVTCFAFKKKSKRKTLDVQEKCHEYESVLPQPPSTPVTFSEPANLDSNLYDEVKTSSFNTGFELTDNKAYGRGPSKPPPEAEVDY